MFSEKEHFVMSAPALLLQAVCTLDLYRLKENLGLHDAALVFSAEVALAHADSLSEYALTLGKQS